MSLRPIAFIVEPLVAHEAQGVHIRRTIGSERLAVLDPLLLLDHLTLGEVPESGQVGFPRHPHRGIETLSYVVSGRVHHRDSLGNDDAVEAGEAQWMTAGKGIFHEEMVETVNGEIEMIQLWFSLPRDQKQIPPAYVPNRHESIPIVSETGVRLQVIAGTYGGSTGPSSGIAVHPLVLQVELESGASVAVPTTPTATTVWYAFEGEATSQGQALGTGQLTVFGNGSEVALSNSGAAKARGLLISAEPLLEPIVQYRSFVMNSVEDIKRCVDDLAAGTFA